MITPIDKNAISVIRYHVSFVVKVRCGGMKQKSKATAPAQENTSAGPEPHLNAMYNTENR